MLKHVRLRSTEHSRRSLADDKNNHHCTKKNACNATLVSKFVVITIHKDNENVPMWQYANENN